MELQEYLENEKKKNQQTGFLFLALMLIHVAASFFAPDIVYENVACNILFSQGLIIIPVILFFIITKQNPIKFIQLKKINGVSVLLLIVLTYCITPLMVLINLISQLFVKQYTSELITDSITNFGLFISTLLFALTPALVEEITYRGVFYQAARGRRPIRAMVVSGLLFGAMHMNINQILYACVMGIIFAVVIEATGSLLSTMIMHFVFNFNSVFLSWALNKLMNSEFYQQALEMSGEQAAATETTVADAGAAAIIVMILMYGFMAVIGTFIGYFVLKGIAKLNHKDEHLASLFSKKKKSESKENEVEVSVDEEEPKTKIWNVWYTLGVIVCAAMAILQEIASRA
ncbi:MAG: CPBP family intramembrane metalloprotease [Lachnospiraceae bacterium]|nr:CPBP family intramembrane metalloprotease [Lachnospiraceae bacterium]